MNEHKTGSSEKNDLCVQMREYSGIPGFHVKKLGLYCRATQTKCSLMKIVVRSNRSHLQAPGQQLDIVAQTWIPQPLCGWTFSSSVFIWNRSNLRAVKNLSLVKSPSPNYIVIWRDFIPQALSWREHQIVGGEIAWYVFWEGEVGPKDIVKRWSNRDKRDLCCSWEGWGRWGKEYVELVPTPPLFFFPV